MVVFPYQRIPEKITKGINPNRSYKQFVMKLPRVTFCTSKKG
ncbi:unnamed protein product [Acanthoscelides obtectus]|uniref:Uncharacterized protein n=1 Tax=Acanthoscelides obtectus TaxID=200917 RepID=A0A9P0P120_ACAOB|nr:unnamed protein product [Acanthoscelides obtectus]CAK1667256.1 hypothetical protein AOBTE_LOCUS25742 [Acanthoscelides obtectus]